MIESIVTAKEFGFLPESVPDDVPVVHGSRMVHPFERLSDICVDSNDNFFVIDVSLCDQGFSLRFLCDLGLSLSEAIEILSKSGNDSDTPSSLFAIVRNEIDAGNNFHDFLFDSPFEKSLADEGDPEAQVDYGICLFKGRGVCQDKVEAVRYFKMAADQGHPNGQVSYGTCLFNGEGVCEDKGKAARYFKMAADGGNPLGQILYGDCLLNGKYVCQDKGEAVRYFKMAADQGNPNGQVNYATCLFNGEGVCEDKREAARYFKMAADQGDSEGRISYAACLFNGEGVCEDMVEAVRYFKMAADQGNSEAQVVYGISLFKGNGACEDMVEAARYFKMAADQGDSEGQIDYGFCLFNGEGVCEDKREAARYFKMAADQGNSEAQVDYGFCLFSGEGGCEDVVEAVRYFKMAADQGHPNGQVSYATCLFNGEGVCENKGEAVRYFKMAAEGGNPLGQIFYGDCLFNGKGVYQDKVEAVRYFQMAADQGHPRGQVSYGICLFNGEGVCQDKGEAVRYFKMAADQGYPEGQFRYGFSLFTGGEGVVRNELKAGRLMKLAAESEFPLAQALYGVFLSHGKCVPWDPDEGARYFERASENGSNLGRYCYVVDLLEKCSGRIKEDPRIENYLGELSDEIADATNLYALCEAALSGSFDNDTFTSLLTRSIDQGCLCAKFNYASYLLHNHDNHDSISKAIKLFISVAHQGEESDSDGYYEYDSFLKKDLGVHSEGRWRFIKAEADAGYCEAQFIYGKHLYSLGSHKEALEYFKKSADNKHSDAAFAYAALSIHEFGGEWRYLERYYRKAASAGVLLAQYNLGLHLSEDRTREVEGARFLQKAALEVLLRREAKTIKVSNEYSYSCPTFMYSPIPDDFVLKATDNFIIDHLSKNLGRLGVMTWSEILRPKTLTIHL